MTQDQIMNGLLLYACFIPVLTFHEFAHAWTAWKCGDDTARLQGRITLNPIAHMEVLGTVVLPLLGIFLSLSGSALAGFIIGWGKPVPVNYHNLHHPRRDGTLVALAGPAMNVLLAIVFMGWAKVGSMANSEELIKVGLMLTSISLFLAFFNLLPVPPLDGSHVLKNAIDMSWETYMRLAQYGFIIIIVLLQIPAIRQTLSALTFATMALIGRLYGLH